MQKRSLLKLALLLASPLPLAACGDKGEPAPAGAAKPAAAPADAAAAEGPLKVAFVYISPVSEEGWSSRHDQARRELEAHFGDKIQVKAIDNVPDNADAERVLRDLCEQGYKLIFATSFGYMNGAHKVAKDFPDVKFEHCTGYKTADNFSYYNARFYQARYLAGKLAASMSKDGHLGYVAAVPIPEVLQGINAFTLGAKSVNPNVEVRVVWTSAWYDPAKEGDAAKSLIGQRCDVITHHTNSTAVAAACEDAKIPVISYNSAMKKAAPTMLLAGVVHFWDTYYQKRIQDVLDGTWKPEPVWGGAPEHMIDVIEVSKDADPEAVKQMRDVYAKMEKREFHPFTGPIVTNDGREVIPAGKTATDQELLSMEWFVQGVTAKLPTA